MLATTIRITLNPHSNALGFVPVVLGGVRRRTCGGHSVGETPGLIPNPEAKPNSADGTAPGRVWESRTPPQPHSGGGWETKGGRKNRPSGFPPPTHAHTTRQGHTHTTRQARPGPNRPGQTRRPGRGHAAHTRRARDPGTRGTRTTPGQVTIAVFSSRRPFSPKLEAAPALNG